MNPIRFATLSLTAFMVFGTTQLHARNDGVTGKAQSSQGCSCHSTSPNGNGAVVVTLSGPQAVKPLFAAHYTLSVAGGPSGTTGGFDLTCASGTFGTGLGSRVSGQDVTHVDATRRQWTFDWTAPAAEGTYNFYAVGLTSDGSGTSGDSWNWNGGAVNTAFAVSVSANVGVDDTPAPLEFAPPAPSPFTGSTCLAFATPRTGDVRLEILDLQGRRAATLVAGTLPAGRHQVLWSGRGDDGRTLAGGVYFACLQTGGSRLVRRMLKLD
jgi:hypothetical protein